MAPKNSKASELTLRTRNHASYSLSASASAFGPSQPSHANLVSSLKATTAAFAPSAINHAHSHRVTSLSDTAAISKPQYSTKFASFGILERIPLPAELWLMVTDHLEPKDQINLALSHSDLWYLITTRQKPFKALRQQSSAGFLLQESPFSHFSWTFWKGIWPEFFICTCEMNHKVTPHLLQNGARGVDFVERGKGCLTGSSLQLIEPIPAFQFEQGKNFFWSEARLALEKYKITGTTESIEALSGRSSTCTQSRSSRVVFRLMKNDLGECKLGMKQETQIIIPQDQAIASLLDLGKQVMPGEDLWSELPCVHFHSEIKQTQWAKRLGKLRTMGQERKEILRTEPQNCEFCATAFQFIVDTLGDYRGMGQCQRITTIRWVAFGDMIDLGSDGWKRLATSKDDIFPMNDHPLKPYGHRFRSIDDGVSKEIADELGSPLGISNEELPVFTAIDSVYAMIVIVSGASLRIS